MIIVNELPPRFDEIVRVFPDAAKPGVIFAFGQIIYNPSGSKLTQELLAHEEVHGFRQHWSVDKWWDTYLVDAEFRLAEELPAHIAEYRRYCERHRNNTKREAYLRLVAEKLASSLYGGLLTPQKAFELIR